MEMSKQIAVLGGTGALGFGLASRFAKAGFHVCIGSRDPARAGAKVNDIRAAVPGAEVTAATYADAARDNDIVILAVPFASHDEILEQVARVLPGKILIDVTAPVKPPKVFVVQLPGGRSVAEATQERLGGAVRVVSAFQNVAAAKLVEDGDVACDILVTGDDVEARKAVMELVRAIGMRPINAGPIANAIAAEALTAVLIGVNKWHKADHAGICITGLA
jgi:NADPH-dependent F420 reductase